MIEAFL